MTQRSSIGKSVFSHCSALATMLTAGIAVAQPGTPQMAGSASVGLRSVRVDGSTSKYRENVNLDDGVRLFDATFDFRAAETGTGVDRVSFDARNLGGDPAETIRMSAQKYGVWNLQLDRRRSEYFYEDVILPPALASVTGSTGGRITSS